MAKTRFVALPGGKLVHRGNRFGGYKFLTGDRDCVRERLLERARKQDERQALFDSDDRPLAMTLMDLAARDRARFNGRENAPLMYVRGRLMPAPRCNFVRV